MAVLKDQHLRIMCFNPDGTAVTTQTRVITNQGRLRVAVLNSNGSLYIATDANPGRILRVTAVG